jgi:arginase
MGKKVKFVKVMSELGAGTRGASLGFEAIQLASLKSDKSFFTKYDVEEVETVNGDLHKERIQSEAKQIEGIVGMYNKIEEAVKAELLSGSFPIVFSGDHSNAGGTIAGIKAAHPNKRLGVIWIDAHADLHSPYTSPSGNVHGMPLATAISEDNTESKVEGKDPSKEVLESWNNLKGTTQRVNPSDIFFIVVRDTEGPEDHLMDKYGIPNITTDQVRQMGVAAVADKALEHLKECDIIYISFDVDSMDPSISRGTGTPVDHGLKEDEAKELILNLIEDPRLVCFETTEVNPLLDEVNKMAEATFRVIKPVIEKIEKKHS